MDAKVVVAVIAAVASVAAAVIAAVVTSRQGKKNRQAQQELTDEQTAAQQSLEATRIEAQKVINELQNQAQQDLERFKTRLQTETSEADQQRTDDAERARFWTTLRDAATELLHRIHNIRVDGFASYLAAGQARRDVALKSTFYRFARYWGAAENVYQADVHLRLERDTPDAWATMEAIRALFTTDKRGSAFMVWREEQRAIGELMLREAPARQSRPLIGFATFVARYDTDFSHWFGPLQDDLDTPGVEQDTRLAELEQALRDLVDGFSTPLVPAPASSPEAISAAPA